MNVYEKFMKEFASKTKEEKQVLVLEFQLELKKREVEELEEELGLKAKEVEASKPLTLGEFKRAVEGLPDHTMLCWEDRNYGGSAGPLYPNDINTHLTVLLFTPPWTSPVEDY